MSSELHLFYAVGYCVLILLIALIAQKFPPKKINWLYGYRTRRSMSNETVWKDANSFASRLMTKACIYSFIAPLLLYFIYPEYNFLITVLINTLLVLSIFISTERYLDKKYDRNGNLL